MTHKEAYELALNREWKVTLCSSEECWCRMIEPVEKIEYDDGIEEVYIVGAGAISKDIAEYLVNLHNDFLKTKA